jgi:HD-like signal output (HDOD) protein
MSVTRQAPRVEPSSQRPAVSTRPPERQKLLDRVLARAGQLPPLPHVAQKILSMTANPEQVSAIALNTMISTD